MIFLSYQTPIQKQIIIVLKEDFFLNRTIRILVLVSIYSVEILHTKRKTLSWGIQRGIDPQGRKANGTETHLLPLQVRDIVFPPVRVQLLIKGKRHSGMDVKFGFTQISNHYLQTL